MYILDVFFVAAGSQSIFEEVLSNSSKSRDKFDTLALTDAQICLNCGRTVVELGVDVQRVAVRLSEGAVF